MKQTHFFYTFLFLYLFWTSPSFAASVSALKGTKVLIGLEGDSAEAGEEFYLVNPSTGKRAAIIRIKQVKDQKALAEIVKGKADIGFTLQAKAPSPMSADVRTEQPQEGSYLHQLKDSYGIIGGYIMNSMTVNMSQNASASMSGSGFTVGGYYNYAFNSNFVGQGAASIEQFNVAGTTSTAGCAGSTNCDAKINYLSLYALAKWYPLQGKYRGWLGGGIGSLFALSKSSTALNESQISTNQVFTLAVGTDIQTDRKNYVPVSIEYNLFPDSPTVKANMIIVKTGWAWNL